MVGGNLVDGGFGRGQGGQQQRQRESQDKGLAVHDLCPPSRVCPRPRRAGSTHPSQGRERCRTAARGALLYTSSEPPCCNGFVNDPDPRSQEISGYAFSGSK